MKNKKHIGIILAVFLVFALAACGDKADPVSQEDNKQNDSEGTEETENTQEKEAPVLQELLGKSANLSSLSFSMILSVDGQVLSNVDFYLKDDKIKTITKDENGAENISYFLDEDYYEYAAGSDVIYKFPGSAADMLSEMGATPLALAEDIANNYSDLLYVYNGEVSINGQSCYQYTFEDEDETTIVYIETNSGLPVYWESTTELNTVIMEYSNISTEDIPNAEFELPVDIPVEVAVY